MTPIERLEERFLLTTAYDAVSKKINITGTSLNDTISVSLSAGNTLSVVVNAVNELNLPSANLVSVLTEIDVSAAGGNDRIDFGTTSKPILTPCSITVCPVRVSSQFPRRSDAKSKITEPGAMPFTISAVTSTGDCFPGTTAAVMTTSLSATTRPKSSRCRA